MTMLQFDSHLPNLMHELVEGQKRPGPLVMAVNLTLPLLAAVAKRAAEIDDPELNILMLRLSLYEVAPDVRPSLIEQQRVRTLNPKGGETDV